MAPLLSVVPTVEPRPSCSDHAGVPFVSCSFHYERVVAYDNTVRVEDRWVQIPPGPRKRGFAGLRVQLQERLDGRMLVFYEGKQIAEQAMPEGMRLRPRQRQRGFELPRDPRPPRPSAPPEPTPDVALPADLFVPLCSEHPWRRASALPHADEKNGPQRRRAEHKSSCLL
jgi:hypothetical protein